MAIEFRLLPFMALIVCARSPLEIPLHEAGGPTPLET